MEENGKRWSKPHVASVTLHNVFELRSQLLSGAILLEADVKNVPQVTGVYIYFKFQILFYLISKAHKT